MAITMTMAMMMTMTMAMMMTMTMAITLTMTMAMTMTITLIMIIIMMNVSNGQKTLIEQSKGKKRILNGAVVLKNYIPEYPWLRNLQV